MAVLQITQAFWKVSASYVEDELEDADTDNGFMQHACVMSVEYK
jgi:hypothetical protein